MQISEVVWVLLTLLMLADLTLSEYTLKHSRIQLLRKILREESLRAAKAKRTSTIDVEGGEVMTPVECCRTRVEGIAPLGALSKEGTLLELYRSPSNIQKFYQVSCDHGVAGKPCSFVDSSLWNSSCTQQFTATYAIVKDFNVTQAYRMDYIQLKSSCSCIVRGPADRRPQNEADHVTDDDMLHV